MVDNVTQFPGTELPENTLVPVRSSQKTQMFYCEHPRLICDEQTRTIVCAESRCGQAIDPFAYIFHRALHLQDAWTRHAHVVRELKDLDLRVQALKREEKRLRALVKRMQDKTQGAVIETRPAPKVAG